uniref:Long-chain-fatty-acid--CoA ligase n=1 Tax=Globisporangium ultimum (strain ATCC 200006 / CBS 805.95 / DAOM BR144) TaxID=431595 RepID=K3XB95_GLOUD
MGAAESSEAKAQFSQEVADSKTATCGAIRIAAGVEHPYQPRMTLYTNLQDRKTLDPSGTGKLFGTRKLDKATGQLGDYEWVTYGEFLSDVDALSSGMRREFGLERNDIVGVFSKNRYEWSLVEHSCNRMTYTLVPLYDTLGPTAVPFIMNHTEMKVVFCAKDQFKTLMSCIHECPHIRTVVQYEEIDNEERTLAQEKNVKLLTIAELRVIGKENIAPADPPLSGDISTICYTSGTTGNPKGALLTHANIMFATKVVNRYATLYPTDVHLSYLPLAHIYERNVQTNVIQSDGAIGFYHGDTTKLMEDLTVLQPTIFPTVPRVLNRIYDKISQGVTSAGGVKKFLFDQAFAAKQAAMQDDPGCLAHGFWDSLVFNKIKMLIGGNVRLMMNGSAPLSQEVKAFIQIIFGCHVLEGYGLTETSAGLSCSRVEIPIGTHVGIPIPGLEVRLEDVRDMNYTSDDTPFPRGEVLVRGRNVFRGYFKQPELTAEVLDADGWFHTGDIGAWNENGTLRIIDRKKNIFKLSQGEYVAPEKIEGVYLKSQYVAQIYVHGDSLQNYLVGVVVPDQEIIATWAATQGKSVDKIEPSELQKLIFDDMEVVGKAAKLFRFERVQKLHVHNGIFAVENDLLTPTFKPKRKNLSEYFAKQITAMYDSASAF